MCWNDDLRKIRLTEQEKPNVPMLLNFIESSSQLNLNSHTKIFVFGSGGFTDRATTRTSVKCVAKNGRLCTLIAQLMLEDKRD